MSILPKSKGTAKAYISGVGMVTPVGVDANMTTAIIKAGIMPVTHVDFVDDDYAPLKMCVVPDSVLNLAIDGEKLLMPLTARQYRLLQLTVVALAELEDSLPAEFTPPVFLAGPAEVVESESANHHLFIENLAVQSGLNIDVKSSRYCALGRAGGLDVIDAAIRYFEQDIGQVAIVGGVDTYYDKEILAHYIDKKRLLVSGSSDGFIPGEGAGFILLVSPNAPVELIEASKSYIAGFGAGFEDGYIGGDKPYKGDGLATAWNEALNNPLENNIKYIMSSMNGEHYFATELGVALTRNSNKIDADVDIQHPAEFCGDMGAAMGPVMIAVLQGSMGQKGAGLVYCSSDDGQRCAITLEQNSR